MPTTGALVHVRQHAIAWRSDEPDKLAVVTTTTRGLVPGGYCVPPPLFRDLAADPTRVVELPPATPISLRLPVVHRIDPHALAHWKTVFSEPQRVGHPGGVRTRSLAVQLAERIVSRENPIDLLDRLIGTGPGNTPTGDQVVVGVFAGLAARGHDASGMHHLVHERLSGTSDAGRHDLAWAMDGEFSERVHMLVHSLHSPAAARAQARRAAGWRTSSGLDLACAVMAGIEVLGLPVLPRTQAHA